MDDDLARAIALSLQQKSKEDEDLERALELSRKEHEQLSQLPGPSKKRKSSEIVEILTDSSDDECVDPDLKMAIELSKTLSDQSTDKHKDHQFETVKHLVDEDHQLALQLQKEFNNEINNDKSTKPSNSQFNVSIPKGGNYTNLLDPEWEVIDPNPDIHALFVEFDKRFFWSSLGAVELEWSKRMYTCAGICYYQRRGPFEKCNIRLSQPLLRLRSRGDLVNTLIHEMIHAFLFVTHNDRDRDGHGPRFQAHMHRINTSCGTNITIYHEWHEETDYYKKHIWRCDGPCRTRKPFFGFVKRVSNRAPGPNDRWWDKHKSTCSGSFIKVGEPTPRKKEKREKKRRTDVDIRQPRITSFITHSPSTTPAHVREKENGPTTSNVLGGKRTGVSRLLNREKTITAIENNKTYKMSDLFSSESD